MPEKIYRLVNNVLVEIPERDPSRRYRMQDVAGLPAYVEFTDAEEAARAAEEAAPPKPFGGLGRCVASRSAQSVPNTTATPIQFDTETADNAAYHGVANPDRFTVPPRQAGTYDIKVYAKFLESTVGAGGTANAGDRALQVRVGATPIVSVRQRASAASDTELIAVAELDLAVGDILRAGVFQNSGGSMNVDARISLRRIQV